ncbi:MULTISPECIES: cysteine hydrolase family protein [Mesonia]|uniref:Streptothricin hydrolase n=1 Tax=Mesonia oceanica TaxID=2687242 RepID=A0AC61YDN1_9FLAO|nr:MULTISPECIES: cysteine hydrolase family protein [Mesonia]MAN27678.1 cysteine hydrolase [Mesonia sp.]MAQ40732.1 cysteine hydrolase [Mesonia sp.]MBJ98848.1 cysteine hydrolase [Flavobacteriaceae bacterium]VVV02538.1 Streptothricin hydrolase [Mesonia oceanica]|tara:strand:- start:6084 stop:6629 length:546 start_codon:yes stop_codon:yes gene_type:complete
METALLLIDIQNDYFPNGKMELSHPEKASLNAKKILEKFRKEKLPVIHIQHQSTRPEATFFIPETQGVEIHENVKPIAGEKIIVKHFPNSFRETELITTLEEMGVKKLVICGMMTHMCVDATTRAAKDFGLECIVIGDACATKDLEINGEQVKAKEVQKSFLAAFNYFYSEVLTTEKFLEN